MKPEKYYLFLDMSEENAKIAIEAQNLTSSAILIECKNGNRIQLVLSEAQLDILTILLRRREEANNNRRKLVKEDVDKNLKKIAKSRRKK